MRIFFQKENFLDVLTPPVVQNPGMETHIHPFRLWHEKDDKKSDLFLHTSPEFHMKELLASDEDLEKIFTINYAFRDEPISEIHRPQFLMLEWYRKNERYEKIMGDVKDLVKFCHHYLEERSYPTKKNINKTQEATVQELFSEVCHFDILEFLDTKDLKRKIELDFKTVPLPQVQCAWDDYFFLIFLNLIEPTFKEIPFLLLKEFPAPLAALSTLKESDPRVCERFEVYLSGIELCNCFNEMTDPLILEKRFRDQQDEKQALYGYQLPWPIDFMQMMNRGYPKSSGVALGVERLLVSIIETKNPFFR
jgi:lysyl-tRNA synthetase class 2